MFIIDTFNRSAFVALSDRVMGDKHYNVGKNHPFFGKQHSEESLQKIRKGLQKVKNKRLAPLKGENHPAWKGDDVGYIKLHVWVRKWLKKPEKCEYCNTEPPYDLANVTGIYKRAFENWKYLCRRCHMISDGRLSKLHESKQRVK